MRQKRLDARMLALIGVLAALVFALSLVEFRIPLALGDKTRIHFGNIMCLVSGVLFGPMVGGMAAGLGSMFYDFTNPLYFSEFWITFLTKFCMGWTAGMLAKHALAKVPMFPRVLVAGLGGQLVYIALYLCKTAVMQHFLYGNPWPAVWVVVAGKAAVSSVNGLLAVAGCALLAPALAAGLKTTGLLARRGTA
ncbi:ECF transporter S component [Ruminococcaceae bacterium OttesenSCG-928-O06]|nr:ECF transporter S component [Ruminococcaceae bacterium OttesenSCG-928-O06]